MRNDFGEVGFADDVFGRREELIEGGLDEEVLGRFVEVLKKVIG